ncbi:MAG TPA: hypothetical protein VFQ40_06820, partial [Actinomycetota bacterium]|nr:hypothetical protein [Actinomycetota bacterium]
EQAGPHADGLRRLLPPVRAVTVAFDAVTSHTGATNVVHTPVGVPKGVIVLSANSTADSTDLLTGGITYGGIALSRVQENIDTVAEPVRTYIYFLGAGIPSGPQTVAFPSGGGNLWHRIVTVTASSDTDVVDADGVSGDAANPSVVLAHGGRSALGFAIYFSGDTSASGPTFTGGSTSLGSTTRTGGVYFAARQTTAQTGNTTVAGTQVLDDVALSAIAVGDQPGPGSPGTIADVPRPLALTTMIDGRPVDLLDWQATVEADWGERSLVGKVLRDVSWAEQGAPVEIWRGDGTRLWSGELVQDPKDEGEILGLRAEGYASVLEANRTRLFYRIDGAGIAGWVDGDSDPHAYDPVGGSMYDLSANPGSLVWKFGNNADAFSAGDLGRMVLWMEGTEITRYSFQVTTNVALTNWELRTRATNGPSGVVNDETNHSLNIGSPTTYARTLSVATGFDQLVFDVRATGAATPPTRRRVTVRSLKVYGRTTDDAFSVSQAASDVGGVSGLDVTGVRSNGLGVLPLDWTDSHPSLLDYLAELAGWRWMVRGDGLHFGPYERSWTASTEHGAAAELEPERRFNRVVVPYRSVSGTYRESAPAEPTEDPYPGREVVYHSEELEDPQPDGTLAAALAAAEVEYRAQARVRGRVELARVRLDGAPRDPLEVEAGDLITLTDLAPDLGAQRIRSITYAKDQIPVVEVGDAPFDPVQTLREFQRERSARHKKKRRRR